MTRLKPNNHASSFAIYLALAMLVSCANANQHTTEPDPKQQEQVVNSESNAKPNMNKEQQILYSRQDLASRLGVDLETVVLSSAARVTWRSSALGCPKKGLQNTQALIPGVLIMLKVGNSLHRYHSRLNAQPFYCAKKNAEQPIINSIDA